MTTPNNAILWNAAIGGFVSGALKGRRLHGKNSGTPPVIGTPDAFYAALAVQCTSLATAVDADIPNDHAGAAQPAGTQAISVVSTGVAIIPSTGAITFAQIEKELCLKALTLGIIEGRGYPFPTTGLSSAQIAAEYTTIATAIEEAYGLFAGAFIQPYPSSPTYNNQLLAYAAYNGALGGMVANNPALANSTTSAEVATAIGDAVSALAFAVDAGIAFDAGITTGSANGLSLPGEPTAGVYQSQLAKTKLVFSLALAAMYNRNVAALLPSWIVGGQAAINAWAAQTAPAIVAGYEAMVGGLAIGASTTLNNPTLYNEAYCGFICGNLSGRPFTTTTGMGASATTNATYNNQNFTALALAAVAFATEVDISVGGIDNSSGIPTGTPAITTGTLDPTTEGLPPTTGTTTEGQLGKTDLLWAICRAVNFGRPLVGSENAGDPNADTTLATYTNQAQRIVACYLEVATVLNTP